MKKSILKKTICKRNPFFSNQLFLVFLGILIMFGSVPLYAQQTRITLSAKDKPIYEILTDIEKKSGYSILVRKSDYDTSKKISIKIVNKTIEEALEDIFKDSQLKIDRQNKNITVTRKYQKDRTSSPVRGMVADINGIPIIGAIVKEKGSVDNGTITNIDGMFTINAPIGAGLEVSYIGLLLSDKKLEYSRILLIYRYLKYICHIGACLFAQHKIDRKGSRNVLIKLLCEFQIVYII